MTGTLSGLLRSWDWMFVMKAKGTQVTFEKESALPPSLALYLTDVLGHLSTLYDNTIPNWKQLTVNKEKKG